MRLTTMSDYAMRLLMYLAHNQDRLCTIAEIAGAYRISEGHLMKIAHVLGQAGFIQTVRGRHGGIRVATPLSQIALGAVVRAIEPDFVLAECFGAGNTCALTGYCRLTGILRGALEGFLAYLDRYTLADLVSHVLPPSTAMVTLSRQPRPVPA
jgi:Rrf2 family nitric oxide-sensitive transcriptional repressor